MTGLTAQKRGDNALIWSVCSEFGAKRRISAQCVCENRRLSGSERRMITGTISKGKGSGKHHWGKVEVEAVIRLAKHQARLKIIQ